MLLGQVDVAETGVLTQPVLETVGVLARAKPPRWILADSRRGLSDFPARRFKMNAAELAALTGTNPPPPWLTLRRSPWTGRRNGQPVL